MTFKRNDSIRCVKARRICPISRHTHIKTSLIKYTRCMDIPDLGLCFPVLVPTKSKVITHQLFGRVGREGTVLTKFVYLDIVDEGFKKLKEFYTYRLPVFMKYATSCSRVIYKDNDLNQKYEQYHSEREVTWPFYINI